MTILWFCIGSHVVHRANCKSCLHCCSVSGCVIY